MERKKIVFGRTVLGDYEIPKETIDFFHMVQGSEFDLFGLFGKTLQLFKDGRKLLYSRLELLESSRLQKIYLMKVTDGSKCRLTIPTKTGRSDRHAIQYCFASLNPSGFTFYFSLEEEYDVKDFVSLSSHENSITNSKAEHLYLIFLTMFRHSKSPIPETMSTSMNSTLVEASTIIAKTPSELLRFNKSENIWKLYTAIERRHGIPNERADEMSKNLEFLFDSTIQSLYENGVQVNTVLSNRRIRIGANVLPGGNYFAQILNMEPLANEVGSEYSLPTKKFKVTTRKTNLIELVGYGIDDNDPISNENYVMQVSLDDNQFVESILLKNLHNGKDVHYIP